MPLKLETFSNLKGGNALYKALAHPLAAERLQALIRELAAAGPVAVYDPRGILASLAELYDLSAWELEGIYLQRIEHLLEGGEVLGRRPRPVTELLASRAASLLVCAFDAQRLCDHIRHLVPAGMRVRTLDEARLPEAMLTNPRRYLDPLNFATNFAFLRDAEGQHTTVACCNYWHGYGARGTRLWLRLYDPEGRVLAEWTEALPEALASYRIDSREVRRRFGLGEFTGSLFMHAQRIAGHDVVKYALDTYGDDPSELSCTHDANAWPADYYAGLPAPREEERVILWIQNSNPVPIPAGAVGLSRMGSDEVRRLDREIPPFGTYGLDTRELFPELRWPEQLEVHAGRHFVRPRYEVLRQGRPRRIAHANVERTDLEPDPRLPELVGGLLGKGHILPAPLLPPEAWITEVQPTPMARGQRELPLALVVQDASGEEVLRYRFGRIPRAESVAVSVNGLLEQAGKGLPSGYGHVELVYDFGEGGGADGWLHGLFRYTRRDSGHAAETSFGAHLYNMPLVYRNEPQSYISEPPGLSTRLFLRLGPEGTDTFCQLIYPASRPWHPFSDTRLILFDAAGREVAQAGLRIPCGGSRLWRYSELFDEAARRRAGEGAYVMIRDLTCRLFGYHGLERAGSGGAVFSLDHMFGF